MILNRKYYKPISFLQKLWTDYQLSKLKSDKLYKSFSLHKSFWPDKLYYYSPRLKRIPRFTGDAALLSLWKESKLCERICPTQAITVTAQAIIIDSKGCITCGLCLEFAPPGLLQATEGLIND